METRLEEILRYLGCKGAPDAQLQTIINRSIQALGQHATPRSVWATFPLQMEKEALAFAGITIQSQALATHLQDCTQIILFAATLGPEVDRLQARWSKTDMSAACVLQACAASAIECYCDACEANFSQQAAEKSLYLTSRFSPGYGDFSIQHQVDLLRILQADKRIGLSCTASYMLTPLKSVTALIGLHPQPQPCAPHKCILCGNQTCPYRKE